VSKIPPFDPELDGPEPKYVRLADHMQAQIAAGELPRRLSSERALSKEYHVSVGTIRKTAGVLRDRGLIQTTHGRGTYVLGPKTEAGTAPGGPASGGTAEDEGEGVED
jgi:GntR family transcriptional regulator